MADYSLYLVTDPGMHPEGTTFLLQVEALLRGGATIVQLREKTLDTGAFLERAAAVHRLTRAHNVPLIINDRVDVALAIGAEGVHVGQDDMPVEQVRALLGPDKIIGVSCERGDLALKALAGGADYIGVGPVFDTNTKKLTKVPFGPAGIRQVMAALAAGDPEHRLKTVVIGGIKAANVQRVLYTGSVPGRLPDGIAVVLGIMADADAERASRELLDLVKRGTVPWSVSGGEVGEFRALAQRVEQEAPMLHHITNGVARNFSANVALALGASPIMLECLEEYEELAQVPSSVLVLNTGTITEEAARLYLHALECYNKHNRVVVYDPVGCGATLARRRLVARLLNGGVFTVIKGNVGEIIAAAANVPYTGKAFDSTMKGVDTAGGLTPLEILPVASALAVGTRAVVVVTGVEDLVVDGGANGAYRVQLGEPRAYVVGGGHALMGRVTASGCSLGTTIAAFVGSSRDQVFAATVAAVAYYKECGARAGAGAGGPGTFLPRFLDELYGLKGSGAEWSARATRVQ